MFVVFWRETEGPAIDPGVDHFAVYETPEEAAENFESVSRNPRTHCAGWAPITGAATEPHWILGARSASVFDSLAREFGEWLIAHGLQGESDDALGYLMRSDLIPAERAWLSDFVRRWDAMEKECDAIRAVFAAHELSDNRESALKKRLAELGS